MPINFYTLIFNSDRLILKAALLLCLLIPASLLSAQSTGNGGNSISANVSINATARVVESIEIATINDIRLGSVNVGAISITVNPQGDDGAGKLLITGRPDAMIRVSYIPQRELTLAGGVGTLLFLYNLSGNIVDNQGTSELIDASRTDFRLGPNGEFFIWIGGSVDVQNAQFGQYEGEFAIEVEYI